MLYRLYNTSYKRKVETTQQCSGVPYAVVAEEFTLVSKSDIKRIAEKKIWTKVWDLYSIISAFKE